MARQGDRVLRSDRLQLNLDATLSAVERAAAMRTSTSSRGRWGPGRRPRAPGQAAALPAANVVFRREGCPAGGALAVNAASLEVEPGPGEPRERRRVAAPQLRFDFDEQGRLVSLQGLSARQTDERASRRAVLHRGAAAAPRRGPGGWRATASPPRSTRDRGGAGGQVRRRRGLHRARPQGLAGRAVYKEGAAG